MSQKSKAITIVLTVVLAAGVFAATRGPKYDAQTQAALDQLSQEYQTKMAHNQSMEDLGDSGADETIIYRRAKCALLYQRGYGITEFCETRITPFPN